MLLFRSCSCSTCLYQICASCSCMFDTSSKMLALALAIHVLLTLVKLTYIFYADWACKLMFSHVLMTNWYCSHSHTNWEVDYVCISNQVCCSPPHQLIWKILTTTTDCQPSKCLGQTLKHPSTALGKVFFWEWNKIHVFVSLICLDTACVNCMLHKLQAWLLLCCHLCRRMGVGPCVGPFQTFIVLIAHMLLRSLTENYYTWRKWCLCGCLCFCIAVFVE